MIVWLASYPRSGNTLLRTVIKETMGLGSTSNEAENEKEIDRESLNRIGFFNRKLPWDDFYLAAQNSDEIFLIKTHRPPCDDNPAIYVVRDGRKSCLSYAHYHESYSVRPYPSLLDLVLGDDYYGGWSDHFRCWAGRERTLFLRYEDLVNVSAEALAKLADHIGYSGTIRPWVNPFDELKSRSPEFFREGRIGWQDEPQWTAWINAIFFHLHGDLMVELGYSSSEEAVKAKAGIPNEYLCVIDKCRGLVAKNADLQRVCAERQNVIVGLKQTCDERLSLIEKLHEQAKTRSEHLLSHFRKNS